MKILATNRLRDGETVWLGAGGTWVESLDQAAIARSPEAEETFLETARKAQAANEILEAELVAVDILSERIVPRRLRERIRANGPSIHADLGKQARKPSALAG